MAPRGRPSIAQAFRQNTTGAVVIVNANHFKSKGSACEAPDAGDGQGNCNRVRTNAANALASWLASDPTGTADPDILIVGDLNLEQALAAIVPVEGRIGREISVRIYSAEDFRTRREQGEHFINNVMSGPLTPLIGSAGDA